MLEQDFDKEVIMYLILSLTGENTIEIRHVPFFHFKIALKRVELVDTPWVLNLIFIEDNSTIEFV